MVVTRKKINNKMTKYYPRDSYICPIALHGSETVSHLSNECDQKTAPQHFETQTLLV